MSEQKSFNSTTKPSKPDPEAAENPPGPETKTKIVPETDTVPESETVPVPETETDPGPGHGLNGSQTHVPSHHSHGTGAGSQKPASKYKRVYFFNKFGLLIWKNFQILKHHKLQTLFEIVLPVLFVFTVFIIRVVIGTPPVGGGKLWEPFDPTDVNNTVFMRKTYKFLYFAPFTAQYTEIMKLVEVNYFSFGAYTATRSIGFKTEKDLLEAFARSEGNVLGGVVFEKTGSPDVIKYKIRLSSVQKYVDPLTLLVFEVPLWHTDSVYPDPQLRGARQPQQVRGGTPGYFQQGFTYLQFAVDASIIKSFRNINIEGNKVHTFKVQLGRFIYSTFSDDRYLEIFIHAFQIIIVLSFIYPINNIVKYVVVEKEKRLMESMKRMGIGPGLHWSAWFVNHIFFLLITDGLMVVVLSMITFKITNETESGVMINSDPWVIFVFLFSYMCSVITFGFLLSTLFSKANTAVMVSWIIFVLTYLPYVLLAPRYKNLKLKHKMAGMLFLNTALGYGFRIILILDGFGPYGVGMHWSNIDAPAGAYDDLSLYYVIIMLFVDAVLYMLITIYIEAVFPGQYGIPKPWYFPVQMSYWCRPGPIQSSKTTGGEKGKGKSRLSRLSGRHSVTVPDIDYGANPHFEPPPGNLKAGIQIRGLSKTFGSHRAVHDLSVDMFENQITALLGHNGAGKTTTMSMLTGLFPPTSGTAVVNDFVIRTHMSNIQGNIGLCPQHDVLFDELTCEQHLKFYCWAKGCRDVDAQVESMLTALNLLPKKKTVSGALSGGMKRKLSVGMALIGGSLTVIFDEPTAGMDPAARRRVWDILASEKKKRTIILSTHFMDEADLLGDRIAVMADGQLQTVGTSLFLKQRYGDGYQLVIVKQQGCDVEKITELVREHLGEEVKVGSNIGAELSYSLAQDKSPLFPDLFDALEERRKELMIDSYGASITTMEQVFMRVGIEAEQKKMASEAPSTAVLNPATRMSTLLGKFLPKAAKKGDINKVNVEPKPDDVSVEVAVAVAQAEEPNIFTTTYKSKTGFPLFWQQFYALLVKKWLFVSRNVAIIFTQIVVPVVLTLVVYLGVGSKRIVQENLELSLRHFENSVTPMQCHPIPPQTVDPVCISYELYSRKYTTAQNIPFPYTIDQFILAESAKSLTAVNSRVMVGIEKGQNQGDYVALFNNQPFHTQPVALNYLMNAILKELTWNPNKEIIIHNHPLPVTDYERSSFKENTQFLIFVLGITTIFGYSFLVSSFVIFLIKEREGKSKHLQHVSGLNIGIFWVANFTFDFLTYMFTTGIVMIIVVSFNLEPYTQSPTVKGVFLLLVTFGWAVIPIVYCSSFWFGLPATGFTKLSIMNIFMGTGLYLTMAIMHIPFFEAHKSADALEAIFLFVPIFSMGYGIYEIGFEQNLHSECYKLFQTEKIEKYCEINGPDAKIPLPCCTYYVDYYGWEPYGIKRNLWYLFLTGFIAFLFLAIIEAQLIEKTFSTVKGIFQKPKSDAGEALKEDSDVEEETQRVQTTNEATILKSENLVLKNLTKHFGSFRAVHNLNLGVQKGECFGLLGVNGAGKTTTFRMLTGDLSPSSGDAFVVGHSIRKDMKSIQKMVGFCPQFDAFINELTGRETIRLFARLRGLHEKEIDELANKLGDVLKFRQFLDKPCGPYSGGNKRKLSTAIALVGNPPLVFLDEPSSGMDPMARRHLWDCITQVRDAGASIILTSHSMEECEALCTRLVIMVNGHFRCLGSIQHLKSKFSEGFTVTAQIQTRTATADSMSILEGTEHRRSKINEDLYEWEVEIEPLQQFIQTSFPDSVLKDVHPGYVHYHITDTSLTWGYLFRKMEEAKRLFELEAYSVGQTSMDEIFLIFGKGLVSDD